MTRVMLVEIVPLERLHRAIAFPFVQGYLRNHGVPTQWVRFAVPADARALGSEGVDLPPALRDKLLAMVQRGDRTHLLFHPDPSRALQQAIAAWVPDVRAGVLVDVLPRAASDGWERVEASMDGIERFLRSESPFAGGGNLFDEATPDYEWEPGHDEARAAPSLPFIVCGEECTYNCAVQGNPCFAEVDLSSCSRPYGCTFCTRPAGTHTWKHRPETLLRTQLQALRNTHPKGKDRLAIRAVGEPVLRNLEAAARTLRDLSMAPCDLLLDARADAILSVGGSMQRALRILSGSGHTLQLCLTGIESFVAADLARMNKGVSWQQNLDAIHALFQWEIDWPGEFGFRSHGGLSLLLMTPWTRLHQLSLNYAIVRRALLEDVCGKLFTSRLRLTTDLPLHALARRDGLLQEAYDDPLLDTSRLNFYSQEVPWRFEQPAMEAVNRLLLRLEPGLAPAEEPWQQALDTIAGPDADRVGVAEALIDAAMGSEHSDPQELVASAVDFLREPGPVPLPGGPGEIVGLSNLPAEVIAVLAGIKPVGRVETLSELPGVLPPAIEPPLVLVSRQRSVGDATVWDTFVGRDRGQVESAIALSDAEDAAVWQGATRQVGKLLGYPDCCTEGFASQGHRLRKSYSWMHILHRVASKGEVSHLLNPGSEMAVSWVPCSLQCEETLHKARRMLAAIEQYNGLQAATAIERELRNPWLLLADHQGHAVEIVAEQEPFGRFAYRTGRVRGSGHPLVRRVMQGDTLEIDEQQILVLERGRVIASLGGRAFVWWHTATVQQDLWKRLLALRFMLRHTSPETPTISESGREAQPGPIVRLVRVLLREALQHSTLFGGFRLQGIEPETGDVARVVLRCGPLELPILIAAGRPADEAWRTVGPLAIYHRREEPIDSPDKQAAVRLLAQHLGARMHDRLRGRTRG